jgi:hypothetical protein
MARVIRISLRRSGARFLHYIVRRACRSSPLFGSRPVGLIIEWHGILRILWRNRPNDDSRLRVSVEPFSALAETRIVPRIKRCRRKPSSFCW